MASEYSPVQQWLEIPVGESNLDRGWADCPW